MNSENVCFERWFWVNNRRNVDLKVALEGILKVLIKKLEKERICGAQSTLKCRTTKAYGGWGRTFYLIR